MTRWVRPPSILIVGAILISALSTMGAPCSFATPLAPPILAQQWGTTSSPHVGAAMTVLATLEQAQVLPPEGTRAADRIIQSVIQLQSLFIAGEPPAVKEFLSRAMEQRGHNDSTPALARFQSSGWTSDVLEALAKATQTARPEELHRLEAGLQSVNLSVADFRQLMQLVTEGEQAFAATGQHFHDVFAFHRNRMPGAAAR